MTARTRTNPRMLCLLLTAALTAPAAAQAPEDPGPYPVGYRDVSFSHPLAAASTVNAVVYYPALTSGENAAPDTAQGPYPQVGFLHGWFAPPEWYSELSTHVASWGFVVSATKTEAGIFMTIQNEADDGHALLHWLDSQGANPSSFFHGLPDSGPWAAYGHSNGAAASLLILGVEPRIEVIGLMEPTYLSSAGGINKTFTGDLVVMGGGVDLVNPAYANAERYYNEAGVTQRKVYGFMPGGGHNGSLDFPVEIDLISHATQHRLHRRYIGGFLRAELLGDEEPYLWLVGEGIDPDPVSPETGCVDPPLWVASSSAVPGAVVVGIAGKTGDVAGMAFSLGTASLPTPWGTLGLDLAQGGVLTTAIVPAEGVAEAHAPIPPGFTGTTVHFQGLVLTPGGGGALSRTDSFVLP